jgi:predicted DNA-binding transcriptional regulator AlpA
MLKHLREYTLLHQQSSKERHMNTQQTSSATPIATGRLTKQALASRLGMSVRSVENLLKDGKLPNGERIGRFLHWEESVIQRWLDSVFAAQRE